MDFNDLQLQNNELILIIFLVFQFDISGKDSNDESENILLISFTFSIFHFDIFDQVSKELEHPLNIPFIFKIF